MTHSDLPPSTLQLPPGPWRTVLECLCERFPHVPRARWAERFARGRVLDTDGRPLPLDAPHRVGTNVRYFREVEDEPPVPYAEELVHVDEELVVADKPHFLPVAPTGAWVHETLLARPVRRLGNPHLVPLHRLDRLTAGLVLFSANPATRARYQALFRERRIAKDYRALAPPIREHALPLERRTRLERGEPFFRMHEAPGTPNAVTRVAVLARNAAAPDALWEYALAPLTGRKHQLRVHMAALGAPIANDPLYPTLAATPAEGFPRPLQLLACGLEFQDPVTGLRRRFATTRSLQCATAQRTPGGPA